LAALDRRGPVEALPGADGSPRRPGVTAGARSAGPASGGWIMSEERWEILSAFVDGEEVETTELARALVAPGAREALGEFVLLRAAGRADERKPPEHFYARSAAVLRPTRRRVTWRRLAAAAALVAAGGLSMWAVQHLRPAPETLPSVPEAAGPPPRSTNFSPGASRSSATPRRREARSSVRPLPSSP
jgi:hypothetical protein